MMNECSNALASAALMDTDAPTRIKHPYRFAVTIFRYDKDGGSEELRRMTRTKARALQIRERETEDAECMEEDDPWVIFCYFYDADMGHYHIFGDDEYVLHPIEQIGECAPCQNWERKCEERYADGRCKRLARDSIKAWRVYALIDPRTHQIRYIGSSSQPLRKRLNQHLSKPFDTQRGKWVEELLSQGMKPTIIELANFDSWIKALTHEYDLINNTTNLTNGTKTHSALKRREGTPLPNEILCSYLDADDSITKKPPQAD